MVEYLRFENASFCSGNCNPLRISAHNLSLLLIFFTFLFLRMYLQMQIPPTLQLQFYKKNHWISNPVFSIRYFALFP